MGFVLSCREDFDPEIAEYPEITIENFSPKMARPGASVTITGTNFGDRTEAVTVAFSGVEAEVTSTEDNEIVVTVPEQAATGNLSVKVWLSEKQFMDEFIVIPGAKIASYSSTSVGLGDTVTITGTNFGSDADDVNITINEVEAEIISVNDTEIQFRVPDTSTGIFVMKVGAQTIEGPVFLVGIEKVTGELFGHSGSWGNNPDTEIDAGVDGDIETFVDANGSVGYLGYKLDGGYGVIPTMIRFFPRVTHAGRMVGAEIRGTNDPSNAANPSSGEYDVLYTIPETPNTEEFTQVDLEAGNTAYQYIYIYFASGGGNLSEIEFYGKIEVPKLTGTLIGHSGSWNDNPDTEIIAAVDGDLSTFVDGATSSGYVGYDLGNGRTAVVTKFRYAPRASHPARMVGGELRASNDPDYLNNFTVLHTIESEPGVDEYSEAEINEATSYRYIYYYSSSGSCNVAEVEFYGLESN
ncbi:IPT/TIG domain-containing protein [Sunxiuqinia indica]|uniref:IPT/TIG domain-containing protein n=1 Tax=Sunxiuqinia indica TaxID=2692584 RepID=UPI001F1B70BF|nr:IPT/TIG domain-containing protein [Sunxiuqinia indica]